MSWLAWGAIAAFGASITRKARPTAYFPRAAINNESALTCSNHRSRSSRAAAASRGSQTRFSRGAFDLTWFLFTASGKGFPCCGISNLNPFR
jgi:hypothetical protein